jgi:hypothetical protein
MPKHTAAEDMLTADRLRQLLHYDPETGAFTWRVPQGTAAKGDTAGCLNEDGRRRIVINRKTYIASRLAWLYVTGKWPTHQIDHKNCVRSDDRFDNLRDATGAQNQRNTRTRRDNACGLKGVYFGAREKRWIAKIRREGRQIRLGYFATAEEAHAAYCKAATEIDPEFARFS